MWGRRSGRGERPWWRSGGGAGHGVLGEERGKGVPSARGRREEREERGKERKRKKLGKRKRKGGERERKERGREIRAGDAALGRARAAPGTRGRDARVKGE